MDGVILDVRIPVAISDVEVTCHDYHVSDVSYIVSQYSEGCLIAVRININHEIDILSIVEIDDIDISMVYKVLPEGEP